VQYGIYSEITEKGEGTIIGVACVPLRHVKEIRRGHGVKFHVFLPSSLVGCASSGFALSEHITQYSMGRRED
jgi:hypothetical protein